MIYLTLPYNTLASQEKLVIAHRGASGYLPEHTLESAVLAFAMKADFLELDVVMTRDGHLIVMHDLTLNATTNVDEIFPGRSGTNGKYLTMEFSLAEIKNLRVHERSNKRGSGPAFKGRFPYESLLFEVPTLEEMLQLVNGFKQSHGRVMGLYIEIKGAEIHRQYNLDPAKKLLAILEGYDYREASDPIWIQSFDAEVLKTMRQKHKTRLKLLQLIGENRWRLSATDFDYLKTEVGLNEVAGYADGIPVEFSNSGSVEINGVFLPIIGKVSMDLVAINCQDANISQGDEAIFWGGENENIRVENLAKQYNMIPYTFLSGVSSRVNRKLINE